MNFLQLYTLWTTLQTKVTGLPNSTVMINEQAQLVEFKIGQNVVSSSDDLTEIDLAVDTAIAINAIVNP